jgi:hypothetical protein
MPNELVFTFPENGNAKASVSLQKTIRVPNDGKEHPLPPGLGSFDYFLHSGKKVLPVGDDEALWFNFSNSNYDLPVAIKILTGGINAITGEKENETDRCILKNNTPGTQSGQNYMIVPGQPWLDGFKGKDEDVVRQFISVKLGQGRSVEEKLENTQFGGIQIIVIPPSEVLVEKAKEAARIKEENRLAKLKAWLAKHPGKSEKDFNSLGEYPYLMKCAFFAEESCYESLECASMGIGAGGKIRQEIVGSQYNPSDFDSSKAQYANLDLVESMEFALLTKSEFPPQIPTFDQWNNAGLPWFSVSNTNNAVKVDSNSRLAALDNAGHLSALNPEQPATQVKSSQVVNLSWFRRLFQPTPKASVVGKQSKFEYSTFTFKQ